MLQPSDHRTAGPYIKAVATLCKELDTREVAHILIQYTGGGLWALGKTAVGMALPDDRQA